MLVYELVWGVSISIHALLAESDCARLRACLGCFYFYPRSPCGERQEQWRQPLLLHTFLSTLSLRRATKYVYVWYTILVNFYPRSPCGERRDVIAEMTEAQSISIHALLAESDRCKQPSSGFYFNFYPRSPCGERLILITLICIAPRFLSTLSLRRATFIFCSMINTNIISIHALLAESDYLTNYHFTLLFIFLSTLSLRRATARRASRQQPAGISIHALLAESDWSSPRATVHTWRFLSTLSLRRATTSRQLPTTEPPYFYPRSPCGERRPLIFSVQPRKTISIHALLAESDQTRTPIGCACTYFYPRSPCGERLIDKRCKLGRNNGFLSTLSLRRATYGCYSLRYSAQFLSTLSLRRATLKPPIKSHRQKHFYPRSPCGERRCLRCCAISCITISIHALLAESDR